MNKKLIAAAIAAVVAAPAAVAADTTLYGKAHVSIDSIDDGTNTQWEANSRSSRLGVKGSEDLGNGLKAIFKYEMGYDMTDGASQRTVTDTNNDTSTDQISQISARNAYVGLSGGFGTVLVGRHDTPAKVAFYAAGNEHIGDSVMDLNSGPIGFTEFRLDNAIAYISPNFSGFTVAGAIVPGETAANDGPAEAYSLGLMYAGGGLKASVGYEVASAGMTLGNGGTGGTLTIGANDHKMLQAGASYTFGDFTVGGQYQDTDNHAGGANDLTIWALAAKANFGNNYVAVNYGNNDNGTTDYDGYGIGVGHKFSKRTQVYAAYAATNDKANDESAFSLGMIHTF